MLCELDIIYCLAATQNFIYVVTIAKCVKIDKKKDICKGHHTKHDHNHVDIKALHIPTGYDVSSCGADIIEQLKDGMAYRMRDRHTAHGTVDVINICRWQHCECGDTKYYADRHVDREHVKQLM